jgi:hypothetical protein
VDPWYGSNTYLGYDTAGNGQLTCTDLDEHDMAYEWTLHQCDGGSGDDYCSNTNSGQCLDKNFWSLIPKASGNVTGDYALQGQSSIWIESNGTNVVSGNLCPQKNWCRGVNTGGWCGFAFVDSGKGDGKFKNDPTGPWYNLVQPCHKDTANCPSDARVPNAVDDRATYLTSQSQSEGGYAAAVDITQSKGDQEGYPDVGLFALEKVAAKEDDAGVY